MNNILKRTLNAVLLLTPLIPLVVADNLFFPFITGKAFAFRILVGVALGLYLMLAIAQSEYRPKKTPLAIALSVFTLIVLIADIFAVDPSKAFWSNYERMEGFVTIAHLAVLFFVATSFYKKEEDWRKYFLVSLGVSTYLLCFGALQLAGERTINQGGVRVDGTLGNAAYFAIYVAFQAFIALYLLSSKLELRGIAGAFSGGLIAFIIANLYKISDPQIQGGAFGWWLMLIAAVLTGAVLYARYARPKNGAFDNLTAAAIYILIFAGNLIMLYFTATRGTVLGFVGGILLTSLYILFQEKNNRMVRRISVIVLISVAVLVGGFWLIKNTQFVQNNPVLQRFATISWNETKTQARSYTWPMAWKGFKERPLLGFGQEGFSYVFARQYVPPMWKHEPWFDRAHNVFLDWLVAAGALGFVSYIALYVTALYMLWKSRVPHVEKALLFGVLAMYAFHSIFVFDNIVSYLFFFAMLAFINSMYSEQFKQESRGAAVKMEPYVYGVVAVASVLVLYAINWSAYATNRNLLNALQITSLTDGKIMSCTQTKMQKNESGEWSRECVKTEPTLDLIKKAISYNSLGTTEVREHFVNITNQIISNKQVPDEVKQNFSVMLIDELKKQIADNPYDLRAKLFYGSFLVTVGRNDDAITVLEEARKFSPKKQDILFNLAQAYFGKGENEKAFEFLKQVYEESPDHPQAKALYVIGAMAASKSAEASKVLNEIIRDPAPIDTRIIQVLVESGQAEQAISILRQRIALMPQDESAYVYLSSVYLSFGNKTNALKVIDQMVKANPTLAEDAKGYIQNINSQSINSGGK